MDGMPRSVIYRHGDRCRKRAYRARVKRAAEAVGLRVAPSLAAVRAIDATSQRDGHAETPRKPRKRGREQVRVGYRKAEAELLAALPKPEANVAVAALRCALTPKQLEHLEREAA